MTLEAGKQFGHYVIRSPIGAGGMGEVFLAEDVKLNRQVALKILPEEFAEDAERMRRFVQEAKSASALNHPNIITIYEIGESGGTNYIATEFIGGETLTKKLASEPMKLITTLEISIQIVSALEAAHSAGIVHRDIKPENIMIRPDGLVKILDFGIAKLTEKKAESVDAEAATAVQAGTIPGMIIGTANYMSPEQAKGKEVDARTDIFSFGVVLYEIMAGHLPFEGETAMEMIGAILHKEPLPLDKMEVPPEIEKIIGKCLRKDRNARYQTIKDVFNDLKDVKQELEFQDKLERTVAPENQEPKTRILQATTADEIQHTSTIEAAQNKPKANKLLAISLAVLLLSAIGFFAYRYFSSNSKQIESIAVMPFVNESGNADFEYLSDGMTETLISSLSQLPNLNVKARSSVFRYKGKDTNATTIGKELNVQAILNGRVVQRGQDLILYVELVDAATENSLWKQTYNKTMTNLVALQNDIARDVADKLKVKLSGIDEQKLVKNYTENNEAYQLYLKGRYHFGKRTKEDIQRGIEYFQQAINRDPNFALAYVGIADSYSAMPTYPYISPKEAMPRAKAAAQRALEIDPTLAEAHTALASVLAMYDRNWTEAEREFKRAIELNPNNADVLYRYSLSYLIPM
ncbi:MAG: protein kinase [Acidobacteriota bacterium]|nr:protein kinase [Acidobacteriota bacterium]